MNNFDKQRIENAIWILEKYDDVIRRIAKAKGYDVWDCEKALDILEEVKEEVRSK